MNWLDILSKLEGIELNANSIMIASLALSIISILIGREFFTWMTSGNKIRRDLRDLQEQLERIEAKMVTVESFKKPADKSNDGQFYFPLEESSPSESIKNH